MAATNESKQRPMVNEWSRIVATLTPEMQLFVGAVFLFGGAIKGLLGFGFPTVILACLAPTLGLKEAMALMIVPGIATNIWQALSGGALLTILRRIWPLLVGSLMGVWAGVQILASVNAELLIGALGTLLLIYSAVGLARPQIEPPPGSEAWLAPLMGITGGVMFGMTGSYIVPGILYVQTLGLSRNIFVQTLGIILCVVMIALALFMSQSQIYPLELVLLSSAALIPAAIGMIVGQRLRHHLSEQKFRKVLFIALCCAGLYMIARSALQI